MKKLLYLIVLFFVFSVYSEPIKIHKIHAVVIDTITPEGQVFCDFQVRLIIYGNDNTRIDPNAETLYIESSDMRVDQENNTLYLPKDFIDFCFNYYLNIKFYNLSHDKLQRFKDDLAFLLETYPI